MSGLPLHCQHTNTYYSAQVENLEHPACSGLHTIHCVYAVTCHKGGGPGAACGSNCQYVVLTKRKAKIRWGEHKTSARPLIQSTSKPVGKHFQQKGHEVHDMKFVVIEHVKSKNPFVLKARESFWIHQYDAVRHGLNISDLFSFW